MQGRILHIGDQHLTDRAEDNYRWELFPVIMKLIKQLSLDAIIFYGDLTEFKDRHTGLFINKIREAFSCINTPTYIIKGNHDYKDAAAPTFKFLESVGPIWYIDFPALLPVAGNRVLFLPHSDNPEEEWKDAFKGEEKIDFISTHITVARAKSENGTEMEGMSADFFGDHKVYSGDIHVPQVIGNVTYIGMPYRKNFGDSYMPRMVLSTPEGDQSLSTTNIFSMKHLIEISSIEELEKVEDIKKNDQVKIRYFLSLAQMDEWTKIHQALKEFCASRDWNLQQVEAILEQPSMGEGMLMAEIPTDSREVLKQFMDDRYPKLKQLYLKRGLEILDRAEGR